MDTELEEWENDISLPHYEFRRGGYSVSDNKNDVCYQHQEVLWATPPEYSGPKTHLGYRTVGSPLARTHDTPTQSTRVTYQEKGRERERTELCFVGIQCY